MALSLSVRSPNISPACQQLGECRTLISIVWSCLSVIITCTWVAVHPNIPSPNDGFWYRKLKHLGLAIVGLVTPEIILLWAAIQCRNAIQIRDWLRKADRSSPGEGERLLPEQGIAASKWTITHGFFLMMGGYVALDRDNNYRGLILPPCTDESKSDHELFHHELEVVGETHSPVSLSVISHITYQHIKDKDKSNGVTKILALGQSMWFIVQCIARRAQGHFVTPMEVLTIAFALLNFVTYGLWWFKPADVGCAIPVEVDHSIPIMGEERKILPILEEVSRIKAEIASSIAACRAMLTQASFTLAFLLILTVAIPVLLLIAGASIIILPFYLLSTPTQWAHVAHRAALGDKDYLDPWSRTVPTLYSHMGGQRKTMPMFSGLLFVWFVFGGIHSFAWSADFPTPAEKWIWRSMVLVITSSPSLILPVVFLPRVGWKKVVVSTILYCGPPIYFTARVIVVVQALVLLRSLPQSAYKTVQWTTFIPHI